MFESFNAGSNYRLVLQPEAEGTYVFIFKRADSRFPERDELQDTVEIAKECCLADFGTPLDSWRAFAGERIR